jgi:ubiquinone/menaquinone biosynthesis C-methylase UbiE
MAEFKVESRKLDLIKRHLPECGVVLDLGAGDGVYIPLLMKKAERVVGLEINKSLCRSIISRGYEVVQANARFIPFKDNTFDCVWASEIVEHTPSFDIFCEIERVSRSKVVVTMPNPWSPYCKRDSIHMLKYSLFSHDS